MPPSSFEFDTPWCRVVLGGITRDGEHDFTFYLIFYLFIFILFGLRVNFLAFFFKENKQTSKKTILILYFIN